MQSLLNFKEFNTTCCNYSYREFTVPACDRQVFNSETGETIYIDYSGHSLLRSLQKNRQYGTDYLCEIVKAGFEELTFTKCGAKIYLTNKDTNFVIIGRLFIGDKEDSYVLSITTVISLNRKVLFTLEEGDAYIRTNVPVLLQRTESVIVEDNLLKDYE